jgi:hypothetical protein
MSNAITGLATKMSMASTRLEGTVSMARKALDFQKIEGAAAVNLIETAGSPPNTSAIDGKGSIVNRYA